MREGGYLFQGSSDNFPNEESALKLSDLCGE